MSDLLSELTLLNQNVEENILTADVDLILETDIVTTYHHRLQANVHVMMVLQPATQAIMMEALKVTVADIVEEVIHGASAVIHVASEVAAVIHGVSEVVVVIHVALEVAAVIHVDSEVVVVMIAVNIFTVIDFNHDHETNEKLSNILVEFVIDSRDRCTHTCCLICTAGGYKLFFVPLETRIAFILFYCWLVESVEKL